MLFRPSIPDTDELERLLVTLSDASDTMEKSKALTRLRQGYNSGDDVSKKISQQLLTLLETSRFPTAPIFQISGPNPCSNDFFEAMSRFPAGALAFPKLCKFIDIQTDPKIRVAAANSFHSQMYFFLSQKHLSKDDIVGSKQETSQHLFPLLNSTKSILDLNSILSNTYQLVLEPPERVEFLCQQLGSEHFELVIAAANSAGSWIDEAKKNKSQDISAIMMQSLAHSAGMALATPMIDTKNLANRYPASKDYECASALLSLIYKTEKPTGQPALLATLCKHVDQWLSVSSIHALGHSGEEAFPFLDLLREFAASKESDKSMIAAEALQRLSKLSGVYDIDGLRVLIHSNAAIQNAKSVTETIMDTGSAARPLIPELLAVAKTNNSSDRWIKAISSVCSADDVEVWDLLEYFFDDVRDEVQIETVHSTLRLLSRLEEETQTFNEEKTRAFKERARVMIHSLFIHENDLVVKTAKNAVEFIDNPIAYEAEELDDRAKYSLVIRHLPQCGVRFFHEADPAASRVNPSVKKLQRALDSGLADLQIAALSKILEAGNIECLLPLIPSVSRIIASPDPVSASSLLSLRCAALYALSRFSSYLELWIEDLCKSLDAPVERQFVPFLICILRESKLSDSKQLDPIFQKLNRLSPEAFDFGFECNLHNPDSLVHFLEKGSPTIMAAVAYALCMLDQQSIKVDVLLPTLLAQYLRTEMESSVYRTLGGCIPSSVGNSRSLFLEAIRRIDPNALDSESLLEALNSDNVFVHQAAEKLNSLRSDINHVT